jgi:hypothetical protein
MHVVVGWWVWGVVRDLSFDVSIRVYNIVFSSWGHPCLSTPPTAAPSSNILPDHPIHVLCERGPQRRIPSLVPERRVGVTRLSAHYITLC